MFVLDTLFTFLLYLSLSLLLLLLEEDELVFPAGTPRVLLLAVPELILEIPVVPPEVLDWLTTLLLPLIVLTTVAEDEDVKVELVEPFDALDDFLCLDDDDDDDADEELPWGSGRRLLDLILLLPLPLGPPPPPPGCCCVGGGSSSFSGDDGPSLELVS